MEKAERSFTAGDFVQQEDENTLEFSVASSTPYLKLDKKGNPYYEILVISEDSINFERLVDGKAPVLFEHDESKQIGVVERAYIQDGKLRTVVRFSTEEFAQSVLRDIKNGIRRNISIRILD